MSEESQLFEKAVAVFLQTLDKNARVTHNVSVPDKDTGKLRQRDIWIETVICKQFPIKIYVSCKFKTRKISQQDMDAVIGELLSNCAHKGVIFSKAGFSKEAIDKAKKHDISCCKLYDNHAPDLPEVLFCKLYLFRSEFYFIPKDIRTKNPPITYQELFDMEVKNSSGVSSKLIDELYCEWGKLEKEAIKKNNSGNCLPKNLLLNVSFKDGESRAEINIDLGIRWKGFEATLEAFLANGSYSFTENCFIGKQFGPAINIKSEHPGQGWKLLDKKPEISRNSLILTLSGGDWRGHLTQLIGKNKIKNKFTTPNSVYV